MKVKAFGVWVKKILVRLFVCELYIYVHIFSNQKMSKHTLVYN